MFDENSLIHRPLIHYYGGKWRIAKWVISHFPEHQTYVEPFGGGASVLLRKTRSENEVYNDLDQSLVNLFRVLRDQEKREHLIKALTLTPFSKEEFINARTLTGDSDIEQARKLMVRSFMGFSKIAVNEDNKTGFIVTKNNSTLYLAKKWADHPKMLEAVADRFAGVIIENRDAFEIMRKYDGPEALIYLDPPYMMETRAVSERSVYTHEMDDGIHERLLREAKKLTGKVAISGYDSDLYNDHLVGWRKFSREAQLSSHKKTVEVLWVNEPDVRARQSRAAVRTNAIRRAKNETKVLDAISQIQASNKKPTKTEVARLTGISREQISRNYANLFQKV